MRSLPDLTIALPPGSLGDSRSTTTANVPVIVGATFGALGGLILLAAVVLIFRRYRRSKPVRIDASLEELHPRQQGPSSIPFFTNEIRPFMATGTQEQNNANVVQNANTPFGIPQSLHAKKLATVLSTDSIQTATATKHGVVGSSPAVDSSRDGGMNPVEDNLRQELEQLRRQMEALSAQQVQQQRQVVYQQGSLPDEPPPMYPN